MNLYESYLNSAKKYLVEDEEDLELTDVDTEEDTDIDDVADDTDAGEEDGAEEPVELDMANPECPECGATNEKLHNWNPIEGHCPKCGKKMQEVPGMIIMAD